MSFEIKPATRIGIKLCTVEGCGEKMLAKGLCHYHYYHRRCTGRKIRPVAFKMVDGVECCVIPLTRGLESIAYASDAGIISPFNWHAMPGNNTFYAVRRAQGEMFYLHRLILNAPDDFEIDHENRNGLDNRRFNLRLATHSMNGANRALPENKTSQYRGVSIYRPRNVWQAQFKLNGHNQGLGHFHDEEEAARAYDAVAKKHFGEFAQLNFP